MLFSRATVTLAVAGLFAVVGGQASAEDFYKGKTVTLMVPSGTASSMGLYGRMLAAGLEKYIPGHPNVILQNGRGRAG